MSIGNVTKGDVLGVVKVHFAWQAWGFVACRLVVKISSKFRIVAVFMGNGTKGYVFEVVKVHFAPTFPQKFVATRCLWEMLQKGCYFKREVCSVECGV